MSSPSPSERQSRRKTITLAAVAGVVALAIAAAVLAVAAFRDSGSGASAAAWSPAPPMPHRRSYTASAEIDGKIYVAAGMVGESGRPLNLLERFDASTNEWTSLRSVPEAFSAAAGAALGDQMYVVGGNSEDADGRQVYVYDVSEDSWSRRAPLPVPRTNLALVAHAGKLYALGGLDPVHEVNTVFVYDPIRDRWSEAAPLPQRLHALAAVSFRGEIWALGGRVRPGAGGVSQNVWIYNPGEDRWRAGPSLPEPMETQGAVVVGDRIHVVLEPLYFIYDAETGSWTRGPGLTTPRHALALFDADGSLYAIGGCVVPQLEDSPVVESIAAGE